MAKTSELRDMSDEQVRLTWKEAAENLFRLRIESANRTARCANRIEESPAIDRPLSDNFE